MYEYRYDDTLWVDGNDGNSMSRKCKDQQAAAAPAGAPRKKKRSSSSFFSSSSLRQAYATVQSKVHAHA